MDPEPRHATRRQPFFVCGLLLLPLVLGPRPGRAQPSGGPYGPVPQDYAVPKAANVYYVAPDGKAEALGTTLAEPTTLEAAFGKVVSGDAIVMRGGTYRTGNLRLNQGITIQPYRDEKPVLKGTRVATEWADLRGNVWRTLPDSGILVLKVNPDAPEGYGTVKIMDANPGSAHFRQATFRLDDGGRGLFKDDEVAVIPLWKDGDRLGVIVTTPERSAEALEAARAVDTLMRRAGPQGRLVVEAKAAFMAFDFKRCIGIMGR